MEMGTHNDGLHFGIASDQQREQCDLGHRGQVDEVSTFHTVENREEDAYVGFSRSFREGDSQQTWTASVHYLRS